MTFPRSHILFCTPDGGVQSYTTGNDACNKRTEEKLGELLKLGPTCTVSGEYDQHEVQITEIPNFLQQIGNKKTIGIAGQQTASIPLEIICDPCPFVYTASNGSHRISLNQTLPETEIRGDLSSPEQDDSESKFHQKLQNRPVKKLRSVYRCKKDTPLIDVSRIVKSIFPQDSFSPHRAFQIIMNTAIEAAHTYKNIIRNEPLKEFVTLLNPRPNHKNRTFFLNMVFTMTPYDKMFETTTVVLNSDMTAIEAMNYICEHVRKTHQEFNLSPDSLCLIIPGTDEIIVGKWPLCSFQRIQEFLDSDATLLQLSVYELATTFAMSRPRRKEISFHYKDYNFSQWENVCNSDVPLTQPLNDKFDSVISPLSGCIPHSRLMKPLQFVIESIKLNSKCQSVTVSVALFVGSRVICNWTKSEAYQNRSLIICGECFCMDIQIYCLPLYSRLCFRVEGDEEVIACGSFPLFDCEERLMTGRVNLGLFNQSTLPPTPISN